jgi:hypothetical protein
MRVMMDDMDLAVSEVQCVVWIWMGGNRDNFVIFSTVERVLTFALLWWVMFY